MKICSDVDGVILNYIQGFIDFTKKEKINYKYNPKNYGVIRDFPNNKVIYQKFHAGDYLSKLSFYDHSLTILNKLVKIHELHLVSALDPKQQQKRTNNLKTLKYTSLQCVGDFFKEEIIIKKIKPDIMIEDKPELIENFHNAGILVFYPDWHTYTKGMERFAIPFSSWKEIPKLIKNFTKF